jgi:Helix-turn-helix domain
MLALRVAESDDRRHLGRYIGDRPKVVTTCGASSPSRLLKCERPRTGECRGATSLGPFTRSVPRTRAVNFRPRRTKAEAHDNSLPNIRRLPMTVKVVTWVFDNSETTGSERLVLLALADHADDESWSCWPSIARIARKARVSESTARRSLQNLAEQGHILIQLNQGPSKRPDRRPNLYRILHRGVSDCYPVGNHGVSDGPPRGVKTGQNEVSAVTPEPRKEPSKNRERSFPQDGLARRPEQRPDCPDCDGTTRPRDQDGNYTWGICQTCA